MTSPICDLHCHSTYSDGVFNKTDLLNLACERGLNAISITDHDTFDAHTDGITHEKLIQIPGVEISCLQDGELVHILAYSFRTDDADLHALCLHNQQARDARNSNLYTVLAEKGVKLTEEEVRSTCNNPERIGRAHIARTLVARGDAGSLSEAFFRYLGDEDGCGAYIDLDTALAAIKMAGGFSVIAHPHLIRNKRLIPTLLRKPFDGLEAYYAKMQRHQIKPWLALAEGRGFFVTGGSDFHGPNPRGVELGSSWCPEETFKRLYERHLHHVSAKAQD